MLTKSDFPETIRADLEVAYSEGLKPAINRSYRQLIEIVPSSSNAKTEVFLGDKPRMRRWRGERQPTKFYEYKMQLLADEWELTRSYKKADLNRSQAGVQMLTGKVTQFADEVESSKEQEFWEFLRNGASIKGFDRANFYDFNHAFVDVTGATVSSTVQSNMHLGGSQLDATTLQLEEQHYTSIVSDVGSKLGLRLTHLAVYDGSANHKAARELNNSQFTVETSSVKGQMTENIFQGSFSIIPTVYGIGASEWISFAMNVPQFYPVKVLSETVNPGFDNFEFEAAGLDSVTDNSFWKGEVSVGVKGYFGYNPGYWMTSRLHGSSAYVFTPSDFENQQVQFPNAQ